MEWRRRCINRKEGVVCEKQRCSRPRGRKYVSKKEHRGVPRYKTLTRAERRKVIPLNYQAPHDRPRNRSECLCGPRPCPFVGCRYHLYLDVNKAGSIISNFPDKDPWELPVSCALDLCDRGPLSLEELSILLGNVSKQAVHFAITGALENILVYLDAYTANNQWWRRELRKRKEAEA